MLRIGKLTDYALLVMGQMARDPHAVLSAASIAEALHLSTPTVSKVLKMLSEAGLVSSVRGAEGGYHLARAGEAITLAEILAAMEGQISLTECCVGAGLCALDSMCTMRQNWQKINGMVYGVLSQFTINDMLRPITR